MKFKQFLQKITVGLLNNKFIILGFAIVITLGYLISSPFSFEQHKIIKIPDGASIKQISNLLEDNKIIRSSIVFSTLVVFTKDHPKQGSYLFEKQENIFTVVRRLTTADYQLPVLKITFTEGMTSVDIAERLIEYFPNFDKESFIKIAREKEGYLFPDTYNLKEDITPEELIKIMNDNFQNKTSEILRDITNSKHTFEEIIIMASIVEKEATKNSRDDVADILWKRYEKDIALQVDAPFVYSIGKGTFDLTKDDLKKEDNPYNTYVNKGLPPTPISNPGIDSILAAAKEKETPYLFFLTGRDGEMYYAKNFDQHKKNRALYLD